MTGLIVDSFAGGGGASAGIEMALGRSPDIAINHDAEALGMHAMNHPETEHLNENIWQVDPDDIVRRRGPIAFLWASPDCKHFSKAKGGKPVEKSIRGLADTVIMWAQRARPTVIILENVEEFQDWGPLDEENKPCQVRKGQTFKRWVRRLRVAGYRVDWRELRARDYGAPTIRKRLIVIARCDDQPIVWPDPTHGAPDSPEVLAGELAPYRTAAEIIDWSIPCPSIFMSADQARAYTQATGQRIKRPLAPATEARIAKGVDRYVLSSAAPFLVTLNHGGSGQRPWSMDEPFRTVTASRDAHALVQPFMTYGQQGGLCRSVEDPLHTVTASTKDQNQVAAAFFVPRYGERPGQEPRTRSIEEPAPTVVPTGNGASLVAGFLAQHNTGMVGHDARTPLSTITGRPTQQQVVTAHLMPHYGNSVATPADQPIGTVMPGGGGKQALVSGHMINLKGADRRASALSEPVSTICANGNHAGVVAAFLTKYYTSDQAPDLRDPMHTVTTRDRFALVTVPINGTDWVLADIGMRMLTPRELFRAQGFPDTYIIDRTPAGPLTKTAQTRMCGNSVCPPLAAALVKANYPKQLVQPRIDAPGALFAVAAE